MKYNPNGFKQKYEEYSNHQHWKWAWAARKQSLLKNKKYDQLYCIAIPALNWLTQPLQTSSLKPHFEEVMLFLMINSYYQPIIWLIFTLFDLYLMGH